jgi:hypothetical protein
MVVSPYRFPYLYKHNNHLIEYEREGEVAQGGPIVGQVSIDGRLIREPRFGGPLAFAGDFLIGPASKHSRFHVGIVNLETLEVETFGDFAYMLIDHIENGRLFFYADLENSLLHDLKLPNHIK